jgi:glycosyltransferase involved in cell wall biosynthesis
MRIGLSVLYRASGGSLTHLSQLLTEWAVDGTTERHELVLFTSRTTLENLRAAVGEAVIDKLQVRTFAATEGGLFSRLWVEQISLVRALKEERIDVVFCPANVIPYLSRVPTVAVFQNAAPFCDGLGMRELGAAKWIKLRLIGRFVRATAQRASKVIFLSRYFHELFASRFGFDRAHGDVILHARPEVGAAARDAQLEARLGITGPYVLCVSHLNPYKRILELVEGFARARERSGQPEWQLVVAGLVTFPQYHRQILDRIASLGENGKGILLTGQVPHGDVMRLLAGCGAFAFTSTCENCPISLIEAMTVGVPIGCSNVGVMPEIGGGGVLYFNPDEPESIAATLQRLMSDPALRDSLRVRARAQAATIPTSEEVARQTIDSIVAAAAARS